MRRNNRTNRQILWAVVAGDFVLLNAILLGYLWFVMDIKISPRQFFALNNIALLISEWKFHAQIQERFSTAGEILKKIVELTALQAVIVYVLM